MPEYLVLLAQTHESFRKAELEALAVLENISVDLSSHDEKSPFLYVTLQDDDEAKRLIQRSILARAVYELWGKADSENALHEDVRHRSSSRFEKYKTPSFKFDFISHRGSRTKSQQRDMFESFDYLGFDGPIKMRDPDEIFTIIEEYEPAYHSNTDPPRLSHIFFGRFIGESQRDVVDKYDLKKRRYIGTTSFDAELALISCNIALAGPQKIVYDPFAGTGSFLVAASHFGAMALGSDIDGRQIRGKKARNITTNYDQYKLQSFFLDTFVGDFTHNPIRASFKLDAIVCDPPYGVREGLKVLGSRDTERYADKKPTVLENGDLSHLRPDYIPPKKPYHFDALLDDLLEFAARNLVDEGRLCCWMPTANEDYGERTIPKHPELELISNCVQEFNRWSRRLLTYVRKVREGDDAGLVSSHREKKVYSQVQFRDKYFSGFSATANSVV
ncbi:S-adenosyl-L-methionine-dependent methyltransferase [Myxozyma melibiosi]|uniref:tRNA (guanine(10)-N(2))-methyltransferase n=1 Tax=Myxozyma melibiosi TaxID=54550 RepID=A0ABR1EZ90_9ASCO